MIYQIASIASMFIACIAITIVMYHLNRFFNNRKTEMDIYVNSTKTDDPERKDNIVKLLAMYAKEDISLKKRIAVWTAVTAIFFFAAFTFQSAYNKSDHHLRKEAEKQMLINRKIEEISRENNR